VNITSTEALLSILEGRRPPRPTHPTFTDGLWELTQRCWRQEAHLRPRVSEVLQDLRGLWVSTREPSTRLTDQFLTYSDIPAWRRLISRPCATDERISLITGIFSDSNETQVVKGLRGDDAQVFVDVMDEVPPVLPQQNTPTQTLCPIN